MAQLERRIRTLEARGSPAPALVHAWVRWLNGMEGIPGIAALTPEERLEAAAAEAATGKRPATVWLDVRQQVWAEEGPRA